MVFTHDAQIIRHRPGNRQAGTLFNKQPLTGRVDLQEHILTPHRLFEAFFLDTPEWKHNVVAEVHMAASQALDGLGWAVEAAGGSALNMKIHRQMNR